MSNLNVATINIEVSCDSDKRRHTLATRGLDMLRAQEVFAKLHLTRPDDRFDYGEQRYITVGWLENRLVALVWTPRGSTRRVISMRHCHEREAKKIRPYLLPNG
jgi:uncharacterized DUF497 family protein